MALHDPDLIKAHEANQRAIALASLPETTIRHFESLTIGQRRHQHEVATMEAIRHDILAGRKCNADFADHHRGLAENNRRVAAALKAIGL